MDNPGLSFTAIDGSRIAAFNIMDFGTFEAILKTRPFSKQQKFSKNKIN